MSRSTIIGKSSIPQDGYNNFICWLVCILTLFSVPSSIYDINIVIRAHENEHHRCSHLPPTPEQVHHVWLDSVNLTQWNDSPQTITSGDRLQSQHNNSNLADSRTNEYNAHSYYDSRDKIVKTRRHIDTNARRDKIPTPALITSSTTTRSPESRTRDSTDNENVVSDGSIQDTLWNLIKKLEKPIATSVPTAQGTPNDLIPMRIQVYYDSSVYDLDKKKNSLITETVMPSVVKFFEDVLSIKKKYAIDRFRIARRCPNNTVYHARDTEGLSRPYCMERCENQALCGEMIVPKEHLSACSYYNLTTRRFVTDYSTEGKGVTGTQLLLYVSAKQTSRCKKDQTIAYAAHCSQDTKTDRPVAGHANLCPMSISTDPKDLKALISTVKHELTHVLGFSVSLFAYFRDDQGRPLLEREQFPGPIPVDPKTGYAKWSDKVIKKVVRRKWLTGEGYVDKEIHVMVTPTVVREVRRHFNCSSLEGAELEDQGSDGTAITHFEKRLFENEAMTGTHTQNSKYSRITLAVLQDTGWYVANFSRADKLEWGKDLGCDFAKKSCKSWIDDRRAGGLSIKPFCDRMKSDVLQIACTDDRASKAVCNMRKFKDPLPVMYRNFHSLDGLAGNDDQLAHFGGSVDLADYCPFIQEFSWQAQNVTTRGSRCDFGINTIESEKNAALEHFGLDSRCFEHGHKWEQRTCQFKRHWHHYGAGCYKFTCDNNHINVLVGNHSYPCYYTDQVVHIEQFVDQWLYNGTLLCPSCDKICPANKCQMYNDKIIDSILSYAHGRNLRSESSLAELDDMLKFVFEEAFNMVDGDKAELVHEYENRSKYLVVIAEATRLIDHRELLNRPSLLARLRQNSPSIFTFPIIRPISSPHIKHSLVCSSAFSMSDPHVASILLMLLISITRLSSLVI